MNENEIGEDFIHRKYGYCYFEIEQGKNPIIFNLYVHPEYRRQGYARRLLQYVIAEIRQTGYVGDIDIEVSPRESSIDREKLESFYIGMGLTVINPGGHEYSLGEATVMANKLRELCWKIEKLPASDLQTEISLEAGNIETEMRNIGKKRTGEE